MSTSMDASRLKGIENHLKTVVSQAANLKAVSTIKNTTNYNENKPTYNTNTPTYNANRPNYNANRPKSNADRPTYNANSTIMQHQPIDKEKELDEKEINEVTV